MLPVALWFAAILVFTGVLAAQELRSDWPYQKKGAVKPPIALSQPLAPYTKEAMQAGIEGTVLIQVTIKKDGTLDDIKVLRGLGYGLDESAIDTMATRWRFQPGTVDGKLVDVQARIEMSFRLYNKPVENPQEYPLKVVLIESNRDWELKGDAEIGYGEIVPAGRPRGFMYECFCKPPVDLNHSYPAKWIQSESRLEVALGVDQTTGKQKVCELRVKMTKPESR